MKCAAAKIVPKLLNFKEKQRHMDIAQEMLTTFSDNPGLLKKVITGDESLVYGYDMETKTQSSAIRQKRTELWKNHSWILHYDNAPSITSHRCLFVSFWIKTAIKSQPLYSPVYLTFSSSQYWFPMKGKHFATIEEINDKSKQKLLAIPKTAFEKCFEDWKKRWHKCIISEGH